MAISIDEFDSRDSERHVTNAERVVRFLAENRDKAYKAVEIADATGVAEISIYPVLNRLEERDLLRHKEPYWAIGDIEEVQDAMLLHSSTDSLNKTLGSENRAEWLDAAQDE